MVVLTAGCLGHLQRPLDEFSGLVLMLGNHQSLLSRAELCKLEFVNKAKGDYCVDDRKRERVRKHSRAEATPLGLHLYSSQGPLWQTCQSLSLRLRLMFVVRITVHPCVS